MNLLNTFRKKFKNIFVGSHRGDDFILENITKSNMKKPNENDMGVVPDEWFEKQPPAYTAENKESDEQDLAPSSYEPPEEEPEDIHQKMYEIATAKYNPFAVGGSENIQDFNNVGGSEEVHK